MGKKTTLKGKKIPRGKKVNPKKIKPAPTPRVEKKVLSHKTGTPKMMKTKTTLKRYTKTIKKRK